MSVGGVESWSWIEIELSSLSKSANRSDPGQAQVSRGFVRALRRRAHQIAGSQIPPATICYLTATGASASASASLPFLLLDSFSNQMMSSPLPARTLNDSQQQRRRRRKREQAQRARRALETDLERGAGQILPRAGADLANDETVGRSVGRSSNIERTWLEQLFL